MLGCHGPVGVQGGGIEGHLLHFGYAADGVGLTGACSLVFVSPVTEELLKQSRLTSGRKHLDLGGTRVREGFSLCLITSIFLPTEEKCALIMWKQDAARLFCQTFCPHVSFTCVLLE